MEDVKERINRFREMGILEWRENTRLENPPPSRDSLENMVRNELVRGALESLRRSVVAVVCRPGLR